MRTERVLFPRFPAILVSPCPGIQHSPDFRFVLPFPFVHSFFSLIFFIFLSRFSIFHLLFSPFSFFYLLSGFPLILPIHLIIISHKVYLFSPELFYMILHKFRQKGHTLMENTCNHDTAQPASTPSPVAETGRPKDCSGRLETEIRTYDLLDSLNIPTPASTTKPHSRSMPATVLTRSSGSTSARISFSAMRRRQNFIFF